MTGRHAKSQLMEAKNAYLKLKEEMLRTAELLKAERDRADSLTKLIVERMAAEPDRHYEGILAAKELPAEKPEHKVFISDARVYINSIERGAETMRKSGIGVSVEKTESESCVRYVIEVPKTRERPLNRA